MELFWRFSLCVMVAITSLKYSCWHLHDHVVYTQVWEEWNWLHATLSPRVRSYHARLATKVLDLSWWRRS